MFVGVCELELYIASSASLKEKRFVVKSIKDKVRHKFNIAISEVEHLDKWQLSGIGMSLVVREEHQISETFEEVIRMIELRGEAEIIKKQITVY